MSHDKALLPDKSQVRISFDRAAGTYDKFAALQYEVADRLLERLVLINTKIKTVLDVGCGTGYCTRALGEHYKRAKIIGLDLSPAMVAYASAQHSRWRKGRYIAGDAESLPVASNSIDLIFSNLALQWCDPDAVFGEFARVLRPGGTIFFSTFGPNTLHELRQAWADVNESPHVHDFIDMHDLGDALMRAGLLEPVMDRENLVVDYADVTAVMRDLKGVGAHNVAPERSRGLSGKTTFMKFRAAYEALAKNGRIPATYDAIYGHAWAGQPRQDNFFDGAHHISISDIGGRKR
ncbi:MAG: malonyl-ACP O-methyltransferase BioC [Acidiferrobacterales bacterium]